MNLIIPKDDAQRILQYLSRQPYGDVFNLIAVLVQLKPALEEPCADEPETEAGLSPKEANGSA